MKWLVEWLDKMVVISFAVLGGFSVLAMAILWRYQGNPFLPILLLPGYFPHAYKVAEWCAAYFLFMRPRFKERAIFFFLGGYGGLEVIFNGLYLSLHGGLQFGVYPYVDPYYPVRLVLYFSALVVGVLFAKAKIKLPGRNGFVELIKFYILFYFGYQEFGAILSGYGTVTNGQWTSVAVANDVISNTTYLGMLWALVHPRDLQ